MLCFRALWEFWATQWEGRQSSYPATEQIKYYTGILGIKRAVLQNLRLTFWDGSRVRWVSGAHVAFDQQAQG